MFEYVESPERHIVTAGALRVEFRRTADRWGHAVLVGSNDRWLPLLTSIEGGALDRVPPSPALQELRAEFPGPQIVEFQLFGQAGEATYSSAVVFNTVDRSLLFDLCVRGRRSTSPLCSLSRYVSDDGCSAFPAAPPGNRPLEHPGIDDGPMPSSGDATRWLVLARDSPGESGLSIETRAIDAAPPGVCRVTPVGERLEIAAGHFDTSGCGLPERPRTVRWRYRITPSGLP
jgi:hypothetical protein